MELDAVEAPGLVGDGHVGTGGAAGRQAEALGDLLHVVAVAHPGDAFRGEAPEELTVRVEGGFGLAVLPGGIALGGGDFSPQVVGQELAAVADAEDRHAQLEDLRGGGVVDAAVAPGEDDADGGQGLQVRDGGGVGLDLAVDPLLPDPAGDELVVLAAEVQNDDGLMGHKWFLGSFVRFGRPGGGRTRRTGRRVRKKAPPRPTPPR